MSGQPKSSQPAGGVSPARKAISTIFLIVLLVVLGIEVRAGLGQANSVKALAALGTEDGLFTDVPYDTAEAVLQMWPSQTELRNNELERVVEYSWFSLLRPLTGKEQPVLFMVSDKGNPPKAISYYTDPEEANKGFYGDAVEPSAEEGDGSMPMDDSAAGGPGEGGGRGEGGGGGGGRGEGGGGGGGRRRQRDGGDGPRGAETRPAIDDESASEDTKSTPTEPAAADPSAPAQPAADTPSTPETPAASPASGTEQPKPE